jgi:hypothetical protein
MFPLRSVINNQNIVQGLRQQEQEEEGGGISTLQK